MASKDCAKTEAHLRALGGFLRPKHILTHLKSIVKNE